MKYTLLELTTEILSDMDSDEVTSISDTTESMQVARIVRQAYFALIEDLDPPEHYSLFELTDSGDNSKPTYMTVPTDVTSLLWVKYDKILDGETAPNIKPVTFMAMDQFLQNMYSLSTDNSNVGTYDITVGSDNIPVFYTDDKAPTYFTSFGDDEILLFDSYDAEVDTRLMKAKTVAYGRKTATFTLSDEFTPDLDEPYFVRLLNEAKQLAFAQLKSVDHVIAGRTAQRSRTRNTAKKYRVQKESHFDQIPNYGRK